MGSYHETYKAAGVDTEQAAAGVTRLTERIMATWPPVNSFGEVKLDIGYFANVIDVGGIGIAISTDGIGSKAMIASSLEKYDTVGIDCVAMNVNDVVCVGARPVSMVDYIAIQRVDAQLLEQISIGLCEGAKTAGISICGGETAQLPDMINGFDLAGTAIGHVALDKILHGQAIEGGDVLLALESNGIHSNGLSLARRVFRNHQLSHKFAELGSDLGTELLRPTHIYVPEALELLSRVNSLKALVHITGDGLLNLTRVTAEIGYIIDALPDVPPIFCLIQRLGGISDAEMFSVFNMGIGFCAIVGQGQVELALAILRSRGKRAYRIGYIVGDTGAKRSVRLLKQGLIGRGKHFRADA